MFLSILNRMILWELLKIFLLSMVAVTGIVLMGGVVAEASQQGLGPAQVLAIIPLLIPTLLPYSIPATILFATCLVYGRLAADNEILAIKSAGVNIVKVVWPGLLLGVVISLGTMSLYFDLIPLTHYWLRNAVLSDVREVIYAKLKKDGYIKDPKLDFAIFVKEVQGYKLNNTIIKMQNKDNRQNEMVIWAEEGELEVDLLHKQLIVHLHNGDFNRQGVTGKFPKKVEQVALPDKLFANHESSTRDMTWQQLKDSRKDFEEKIQNIDKEIDDGNAGRLTNHAPENIPKHVKNLKDNRKEWVARIRQVDTEFQMRPALAFGCLCFVLIGCPVGIWFSRSDYLSAFISCFLPVVFIYYPIMLCGINFAKEGPLHPAVTVWAANTLVALAGLGLYQRLLWN